MNRFRKVPRSLERVAQHHRAWPIGQSNSLRGNDGDLSSWLGLVHRTYNGAKRSFWMHRQTSAWEILRGIRNSKPFSRFKMNKSQSRRKTVDSASSFHERPSLTTRYDSKSTSEDLAIPGAPIPQPRLKTNKSQNQRKVVDSATFFHERATLTSRYDSKSIEYFTAKDLAALGASVPQPRASESPSSQSSGLLFSEYHGSSESARELSEHREEFMSHLSDNRTVDPKARHKTIRSWRKEVVHAQQALARRPAATDDSSGLKRALRDYIEKRKAKEEALAQRYSQSSSQIASSSQIIADVPSRFPRAGVNRTSSPVAPLWDDEYRLDPNQAQSHYSTTEESQSHLSLPSSLADYTQNRNPLSYQDNIYSWNSTHAARHEEAHDNASASIPSIPSEY